MDAERSAVFGWSLIALGVIAGLALGLFALGGPLPAPDALADYAGLPRRLLRLSHIALVALGALNVLHALDAPRGEPRRMRLAGLLLAWGSVLLPANLALAAFVLPARFAAGLPAILVAAGVALHGAARRSGREGAIT